MRMVKVTVKKSELQSQTVTVGEWEVPVLMAVHGSDDVVLVKRVSVKRDVPEAGEEYERLLQRYGADEDSGIPWVGQVYGQHGPGVMSLARAIEASQQKGGMAGGGDEESEEGGQQAASA